MRHGSSLVKQWCKDCKVIPVLTINSPEHALPIAEALVKGGIRVIEVTLRTQSALQSIASIRKAFPGLIVAAGTVRYTKDIYAAKKHQAHFAVSPGTTMQLLDAAFDAMLPIMPGVASASEVMGWNDYGMDVFKFFPAEHCGGHAALKAFYPPLSNVSFCPTGGINTENARLYLDLPNVLCVGGSWLVTPKLCQAQDWATVTRLAQQAMAL